MNRLDRLFAIATHLQGRSRVRAEDLARAFEVSKRTIYRDVVALSEAGVPIVAEPGQGYGLADGYFLPPLVFTSGEATALVLGARLLASRTIGRAPTDAEHAIAKIAAVLTSSSREEVDRRTASVRFLRPLPPDAPFDLDDPRLVTLRRAARERRVVALRYHGRGRDEVTDRRVEPADVECYDGVWYLSAHCRLRGALRHFRLERIDALTLLDETFSPRSSPPPDQTPIEVRVRFAEGALRWVRERQHWSFRTEETDRDGTLFVYKPDGLGEIAPWLLGWGTAAELVAPAELRTRIRDEARAVAEMLT
ncbi:MAG: YafY family transcriptional regulator [Chloroflexota bacterium]|nr:YafY family transcriptional regulator [Chloroflexota bacterium]